MLIGDYSAGFPTVLQHYFVTQVSVKKCVIKFKEEAEH